ncbi:Rne/Rng family ribonuclease [candidate division WOR-3 bacterium]|uniref:Ribonuclease G n=1 Tax=candidate division WOR-3 bacterium TaxID=2052148 RepID=A0A9D5KAP4_UNCW3|nr:Rne/Rng family ribonuclease [candidate division WOR-3 bacterium]MBD3364660.1 Rne/Rng family ribonuclease [candidate division WOR-3 bacterium]
MKKEILINVGRFEIRTAVLEDGKLIEFYSERPDRKNLVGRIYKGRVENVVPGLAGAFVNIGLSKNGFLPLSDIPDKSLSEIFDTDIETEETGKLVEGKKLDLKPGQEILVQVVKEPLGKKGARLSSYIFLPGRFLVLTPSINHIGVSRRIRDRGERSRLRSFAAKLKKGKVGLIVRTAAEKATEAMIRKDLKTLNETWNAISDIASASKAPLLAYEEPLVSMKLVRDQFTRGVSSVVVDSRVEYENILRYLRRNSPRLRSRVRLFQPNGAGEKTQTMFENYGVESELKNVFERKIWLKNGGFITIDHTEAMVAIDVNTGRFSGEERPEDLIFRTNMEAAAEIARQIRLRDLSGLLVIDFIDMRNRDNMNKVLRELKRHLREDKAHTDFSRFSRFGLIEITRERKRPGLFVHLTEECSVCRGLGRIPSREYLLAEIERVLEQHSDFLSGHTVLIKAESRIADYLSVQRFDELSEWARCYKVAIEVKTDIYVQPGEYSIILLDTNRVIYKRENSKVTNLMNG